MNRLAFHWVLVQCSVLKHPLFYTFSTLVVRLFVDGIRILNWLSPQNVSTDRFLEVRVVQLESSRQYVCTICTVMRYVCVRTVHTAPNGIQRCGRSARLRFLQQESN